MAIEYRMSVLHFDGTMSLVDARTHSQAIQMFYADQSAQEAEVYELTFAAEYTRTTRIRSTIDRLRKWD